MSIPSFISYLQHERHYASHTLNAYRNDIQSFFKFCREEYEVEEPSEITYRYIRFWIVRLSEKGLSNRSVNRKLSALRSYFNFMMKTGLITQNPMAEHRSLKEPKKVQVPFTEKEVENALNYFNNDQDFESVRNKLVIEMLYLTGMRRAELIGLQLNDVDTDGGVVKVLGKRNKERIIPLLNSVTPSIQTYLNLRKAIKPDVTNFFITKNGKPLYQSLVYTIVKNAFDGVTTKLKKSPHILRHSFATHLLNKGADLNSVKELLGHASLASTQVYTHNSLHDLKNMYNNAHPRSSKKQ